MIISFSVSNFRSFSEEATLNLVASNKFQGHHDSHAVVVPDSDQKVLRAGILYGANGAGKSNLFRALSYVRTMVLRPRASDRGTGREAFRLAAINDESSSFDITFVAGGKTYRFGFKADDIHIVEEWLVCVEGGREKVVYERTTDDVGSVTVESKVLKAGGDKLAALVTVGGPKNQTFLATVSATLESAEYGEVLGDVLAWFTNHLTLIAPEAPFHFLGRYVLEDKPFLEFAGSFLRAASTGVDGLKVSKEEISADQLRRLVTEKTFSALTEGRRSLAILEQGAEIVVEREGGAHYFLVSVVAEHKAASDFTVDFDLGEESDGTLRLLNLLPVLHRLRHGGGVFVIDEIDRSMHPQLVWKFIEFFLKNCEGAERQVIVTTHECNLLDLDLVRRDEIWFAEKNQSGATHLYSLADFKVRKDLDIRKHYIQGRFGAIPFLGDIDRLAMEPVTAS